MNNSQKFRCCGNNCEECNGNGIVLNNVIDNVHNMITRKTKVCEECNGTGLGPNIIENLLLDAEDSILIYETCQKCKNKYHN